MIKKSLERASLNPAFVRLRAELRVGVRALLGTDRAIIDRYIAAHSIRKLQLGTGNNPKPGWLNSGYMVKGKRSPHIDARDPFPIPDCSFDYVFSEHLIEHLRAEEGKAMLSECFRILRPGGRVRISSPSLEALLALATEPLTELQQAYLQRSIDHYRLREHGTPSAAVINNFMRAWGHLFIYDRGSLEAALSHAGFVDIELHACGKSRDPVLQGLENEGRMPPGHLSLETMSMEAVKPMPSGAPSR